MFQTEHKTPKMIELEERFASLDREIKDAQLSGFPSNYKPLRNAISRRSKIKKQWFDEWNRMQNENRPKTIDEALERLGKEWFAGAYN